MPASPGPEDFLPVTQQKPKKFSRDIGQDWNIRQVGTDLVGTYKPTGANHILAVNGASVGTPISVTVEAQPAASGSTTSTSYVDYPGPVDLSFTKRITASSLVVQGTIGAYISVAAVRVFWSLAINGVDYDIGDFFFNDSNTHRMVYGARSIASGLAAGVYTARVRWKVSSGTVNADANDVAFYSIIEAVN